MSADEIRKLTDLSAPIMPEHWQATVMWPEQWDKIKAALLAYAAMVERCEERRYENMDLIDYILKGEAK